MAFLFVDPKAIEIDYDDKTGEVRIWRLKCTELEPRSFNVNLMKQPASIRNQLQKFVDQKQPIMLPIKEGQTSDGQSYFQLVPGQIIPVSLDYVKSLQAEQQAPEVLTSKVFDLDTSNSSVKSEVLPENSSPTSKTKELKFG